MKVSFEGIGESVITFYNSDGTAAKAGEPVMLSGNGEIRACSEGERLIGVALACDESFAAVQTMGYIELPFSGTAPDVGYEMLVANGAGGVKTAEAGGGEFLIIEVDEAAKVLGFML